MVSSIELGLFAIAMFVLVASPGPFVAALAARSAAFGPRSGVAMALGANLSEAIWITTALLGLGAIAQSHASALVVLKYIGALWLIWIGLRLMSTRQSLFKPSGNGFDSHGETPWRAFGAGVLLNLGNPKAALFYISIFPGFFDMTALTLLDGVLIFAVALPIGLGSDLTYVWAAVHARRFFNNKQGSAHIDRASGAVLTGAGVVIAAS